MITYYMYCGNLTATLDPDRHPVQHAIKIFDTQMTSTSVQDASKSSWFRAAIVELDRCWKFHEGNKWGFWEPGWQKNTTWKEILEHWWVLNENMNDLNNATIDKMALA